MIPSCSGLSELRKLHTAVMCSAAAPGVKRGIGGSASGRPPSCGDVRERRGIAELDDLTP